MPISYPTPNHTKKEQMKKAILSANINEACDLSGDCFGISCDTCFFGCRSNFNDGLSDPNNPYFIGVKIVDEK